MKKIILIVGIVLFFGGCVQNPKVKAIGGAFSELTRIESELKRGVSKKSDVQRLLGQPSGSGGSSLPTVSGQRAEPREIWYYEGIEMTTAHSIGGGIISAEMRQQILLIFFDKEIFDGFMWYTNVPQ